MNKENPNVPLILSKVVHLIDGFLYYDRKEDERLPPEVIEDTIRKGDLTVEDIVKAFSDALSNTGCIKKAVREAPKP